MHVITRRSVIRNGLAARQAELKVAEGKSNVFVYYFQWNTPLDGGKLRAFHTSDLPLEMRDAVPGIRAAIRATQRGVGLFRQNGEPEPEEFAMAGLLAGAARHYDVGREGEQSGRRSGSQGAADGPRFALRWLAVGNEKTIDKSIDRPCCDSALG